MYRQSVLEVFLEINPFRVEEYYDTHPEDGSEGHNGQPEQYNSSKQSENF